MPDRLFGIPAHPLLVHVPVVLLPLCVVIALMMVTRPRLVDQWGYPAIGLSVVAAIGTILAAETGEGLERILNEKSPALENHAKWGDITKIVAVVFVVFLIAFVLITKRRSSTTETNGSASMKGIAVALTVAMALSGIGTVFAVVKTGHSGATQAWEDAGKEG